MKCQLNYGTAPTDSLALYVADNPDGPARKVWTIRPLQSAPPEGGTVKELFYDAPPYSDCYYFWLDHGSGDFPPVRSVKAHDLRTNQSNPICYSFGGSRPLLDPPDITQIADPAMNDGDELVIMWSSSSDSAAVHFYNIYGAQVGDPNGFRWLGTVPPGVNTFTHSPVAAGVAYAYKVSAAHGDHAVWNDFGGVATGVAVDELTSGLIAHDATWSGTMFIAGDVVLLNDATLTIDAGTTVWVWPTNSEPNLGDYNDRVEINVRSGTLLVNGTAENPVRFQAWNNGGPVTVADDKWAGISIGDTIYDESSSSATIDYAEIRNAYRGLQAHSPTTIRNSIVEHCKYVGVSITGDSTNVDSVFVSNTTIRHIAEGVGVSAVGRKASIRLNNCVIDSCAIGVEALTKAKLYTGQTTVRHSATQGIKVHGHAYAWLDHSTIESSFLAALKITDGATVDVSTGTFKTSDHGIDIGAHGGAPCGLNLVFGTVAQNEVGLQATSGAIVNAVNCTVTSNSYEGFYCFDGSDVQVAGSVFTGNESGLKADTNGPLLTSNTLSSNVVGVYCDTNSRPVLRKNKVESNDVGIELVNDGTADLSGCGGVCPSSCANANSIKSNSTYHIFNDSGSSVDARCTYWGGSVPAQNKMYGSITFIPYLTSNPLQVSQMPEQLPSSYRLAPNYPNPFNPVTTIAFDVPPPGGLVRLRVYNVNGQLVKTLMGAARAPGHYEMSWDGRDDRNVEVATGIYFLDMVAPNFHKARKLVLIK